MHWNVCLLPVVLLLVTSIYGVHSQSCGIVGSPPTTIIIEGIPVILPTYTKIWETELFNVTRTSTSVHPHSKYIEGILVNSVEYYFRTSPVFQNFIADQSSTTITRKSTFYCLGGGTVVQNFEIRLNVTDKKEPVFVEQQYSLEIHDDWELDVSINPWAMIIVRDADTELANAELSFSTSLKSENGSDLLKAVGTPLWPNDPFNPPPPGTLFYYRVDLYLNEPLRVGSYEFYLNGFSRFNSGSTSVNLIVK